MPLKAKNDLSIERARELFDCDPHRGVLFWRQGRFRGYIAGSLNRLDRAVHVNVRGRIYLAHRLIWLLTKGEWPVHELDHINGDRADNRMKNLRDAPHAKNIRNRQGANKNSKSGILGVRYRPTSGRWQAYISVDGKQVWTFTADTAEEATAARRKVLPFFHEEFAAKV
jgi:hypothetical protein